MTGFTDPTTALATGPGLPLLPEAGAAPASFPADAARGDGEEGEEEEELCSVPILCRPPKAGTVKEGWGGRELEGRDEGYSLPTGRAATGLTSAAVALVAAPVLPMLP